MVERIVCFIVKPVKQSSVNTLLAKSETLELTDIPKLTQSKTNAIDNPITNKCVNNYLFRH